MTVKPIRISYSSLRQYEKCPRQYNWQRIERRPVLEVESRHHAMLGTVIQATFEDFYNKLLWKLGGGTSDYLKDLAIQHLETFLRENHVNWKDSTCNFTKADIVDELFRIIPATIQTIKREKLLGPYAKSEVPIELYLNKDIVLGNLDFVIRTTEDKVWIVDGKATKHRETRVDPDQLYFYAMLFYMRYQHMPDRLAFLYYYYADQPDKAMDWLEVDPARVHAMRDRTEAAIAAMREDKWQPIPTPSNCQYCNWQLSCEERKAQKEVNSAKRKKTEQAPVVTDDDGFVIF